MSTFELPAVHFDLPTLANLERKLRDRSSNPSITIRLTNDGITKAWSTAEAIDPDTFPSSQALAYELDLTADDGQLIITGDGNALSQHHFIIEGDSGWEKTIENTVITFYENQRNDWANWYSQLAEPKYTAAQFFFAIIAGAFLASLSPGYMVRLPPCFIDYLIFPAALTGLLALRLRSWLYPYVQVTFEQRKRTTDERIGVLIRISALATLGLLYLNWIFNPGVAIVNDCLATQLQLLIPVSVARRKHY